jgi:hypothetical protein
MFFCSVNHRKQHLLSRLCPWPGEYVRQERRAGGTGTSRSGREATEAPAMPLATLTNTGIGPTLGPTNKEWASKLGKLGKCSEINIKLRIINLSSKNGHGLSPGFGMVSMEFWLPGSTRTARRSSRPWQAAKAGLMVCWMVFDCGYKISSSLYQDYIFIYIYKWF